MNKKELIDFITIKNLFYKEITGSMYEYESYAKMYANIVFDNIDQNENIIFGFVGKVVKNNADPLDKNNYQPALFVCTQDTLYIARSDLYLFNRNFLNKRLIKCNINSITLAKFNEYEDSRFITFGTDLLNQSTSDSLTVYFRIGDVGCENRYKIIKYLKELYPTNKDFAKECKTIEKQQLES